MDIDDRKDKKWLTKQYKNEQIIESLQEDKKIVYKRILYDIYKKQTIKGINKHLKKLCLIQLEHILEQFNNDLMFK